MMRFQNQLLVFFTLLAVLANGADADLATLIVEKLKTVMEAIKVGKNIFEVFKEYPPILMELLVAASDKTKPVPRRSYDFIVDLTRPTNIFEELKSYPITFPLGKDVYDQKVEEEIDRFILNVVGRYNVGKTYVLRLLANINLGHSFTERTIGVSVSLPPPNETNNTPLALIDTAGTRTPVTYDEDTFPEKSYQRQVSDSFIQEIAFNSADVYVLVVNQMTLDDQLYLKTLTKRLKAKGLKDKDIKQQLLIVHNYFNLQTVEEVQQVEESELKQLFGAKKNPQGFWSSENFKHFVIAHSESPAGKIYNAHSIENIRNMIKGAHAVLIRDVLNKIVKEIESLLGKVLVEELPDKYANPKVISPDSKNYFNRAVNYIAAFWPGSGRNELKVSNKQQVEIELEVKSISIQSMEPLWFICPKHSLSNSTTLSKNLGFNQDGSVYVDFSSQFVPDINIVRVNDHGDVRVRLECPLCVEVTASRDGMTSILIQGEKTIEPYQIAYLNTRRVGKFEMKIALDGLEKNLILNLADMKTEFSDGVVTIHIPSDKSRKETVKPEEL